MPQDLPASPPTPAPTLGIVLAGGRARRMGGVDKPLLTLGGRTLLAHIVTRLAPQCAGLVLSANGDPARFPDFPGPVLPDSLPDRPGPLAGVLAGLEHAARHRPDLADCVSVSGDAPFLPYDLVARLHAARAAAGAPLALAASDAREHYTVALWQVALAPALRAYLEAGERRVGGFLRRHGAARASWPSAPVDPFANLNTPEDLAAAEAALAHLEP